MDKKTVAILITVAAVLLCGCPGLFSLCFGGMFAVISFIPGADVNVFGSTDPASALPYGIGSLCAGIVFLIIAVVAIVLAWRRSKADNALPPQTY